MLGRYVESVRYIPQMQSPLRICGRRRRLISGTGVCACPHVCAMTMLLLLPTSSSSTCPMHIRSLCVRGFIARTDIVIVGRGGRPQLPEPPPQQQQRRTIEHTESHANCAHTHTLTRARHAARQWCVPISAPGPPWRGIIVISIIVAGSAGFSFRCTWPCVSSEMRILCCFCRVVVGGGGGVGGCHYETETEHSAHNLRGKRISAHTNIAQKQHSK